MEAMTPDELERILDQQRQRAGADRLLYFVAFVIVAVVLVFVYARR
jgi:predicted nucleic acid-binding Zn ribbon protein